MNSVLGDRQPRAKMNSITDRHVASIGAPIIGFNPINGHRYQGWKPCIDWCEENFGNKGGWWYIGEGVFEFSSQEDYMMFTLRWGK